MEIDQIVHVKEIRLQRKSGKLELARLGGPWQPLWARTCTFGVRVLPPPCRLFMPQAKLRVITSRDDATCAA